MNTDSVVPVVSVVIPCFNAERWLAEAVQSALAQSVPGVEVVVVNDGSTDRSRQVAEQFGDRITLIDQPNRGVSAARRKGVRRSKGQFIKFLDADDLLPPGALEALLVVAKRHPGEAVLGHAVAVDDIGRIVDRSMYELPVPTAQGQAVRHEYLLTQPTSSGLWLLPKDRITGDNFFDTGTNFAEEYVFCSELVRQRVPVRACDAVVYRARMHASHTRLSRSRRETDHLRQADLMRQAVNVIRQEIPNHDPYALSYLARLSWSRGRDSLRLGLRLPAEQYFQLAREVEPGLAPVGSPLYRMLSRMVGPYSAEYVLGIVKRLLGRSHQP